MKLFSGKRSRSEVMSEKRPDQDKKINQLNHDNSILGEVVKNSSIRLSQLEEQSKNSEKLLAEKNEKAKLLEERIDFLNGEMSKLKTEMNKLKVIDK